MGFIFFFSSRRRHTRWNCDWSSDVCSSDLEGTGDAHVTLRNGPLRTAPLEGSAMAHAYTCEIVNVVDNKFAADSRDKDGKRVVMFDSLRTIEVYLFPSHIIQIEAVKDSKDGTDR